MMPLDVLTHVVAAQPLSLLQQPGPDSPFGNVLGWIIVFMVIVWPILRGILEAATKRRKEFEESQRASGGPVGGPAAGPKRRRGGLGDLLSHTLEALEQEATGERRPRKDGTGPPRRARATSKQPPAQGSLRASSLAPAKRDTAHRDLVGDPFDESTMALDLVPDDQLVPVPPEDALESDYAASMPKPGGTREPFVEPPARKLSELDRPEVRKERDVLGRLERRLSPWQRAFALSEILGPPIASRPPSERHF